ncbi:PepSY-associated TM helix domain-containing protein [Chryseobacterium populi]|uniref:Putative iron-regulated membrane protein n=1 Tax=Chryseobacterium populi TaxID=1144316 RepID=J3CPX2_9FLAO|nr:PepSY-associated TM helix domain-containing protein [Chryseobacterium populi]EJL75876.1 putative iron-regulated membrane protein [Chryseobacterium populi]
MEFRKLTFQLHLWLGLTSGLIVVIMAATGCILSFEEELKLKFHPERYFADSVKKEKLSLPDLKAKAEKALPDNLKVSRVEISSDPGRNYVFRTLKIDDEALTFWGSYIYYYRVYINPYTGKIAEVENAKQDFFEIVQNLHRRLLLGEKIGKNITGYTTLFFLIIIFSGLVIWYPRKMSKNMLKGMFMIKITSNLKRLNYDLHNVLGFYAAVPLLLICYSAVIWNFKDIDRFVQDTLNGKHQKEGKVKSDLSAADISDRKKALTIVGNTVKKSLPSKESALITFPKKEEGTYYAEIKYAHKQYQNDQYNFDQYSGKILKFQSYKDQNIGNGTALRERNYDLHTGGIFGLTGRILYLLAGIIALSLPVTGFIMWLNKKKKSKNSRRKKAHRMSHKKKKGSLIN